MLRETTTRYRVRRAALLFGAALAFAAADAQAAGTLTVFLAVWVLLAAIGLGQLLRAVRRLLR